jgi:hypothetical protein
MQISNNYQASPNFGRLMINKKAAEELKKLPSDVISQIRRAGEILKDTKYYHAEIDENLEARLVSEKNPYFGLFQNDKYTTHHGQEKVNGKLVSTDKIVIVDEKNGSTFGFGVGRYVPYGETKPFYNVWGAYGGYNRADEVEHIAKAAKVLDDVAVKKAAEAAEKQSIADKLQAKVNSEVDDLMSKFGV